MRLPRIGPAAVAALCVVGAVVLFVATVMGYGRRELFDTAAFTERSVEVIHEEPVRDRLADVLARQVIESGSPDLVALRPLITDTLSSLIDSGTLDPVLSVAVAEVHRSFFTESGSPLVLSMKDAIVIANGIIAAVQPGTELPDASTVGQVKVAGRDNTAALRIARRVRWLGVALPIIAVLLLAAAVALARDRRRAVTAAGIATAGAGLLVILAAAVARPLVVGRYDGDARDVADATWAGLVGGLHWWGLALVGAGVVIAAAAAAILPSGDVAVGLARVRAIVLHTPRGTFGTWVRVGRAAAAIGIGFLAVVDAETTLRLILLVAGGIAMTWGITEIMRITAPSKGPQGAEEVAALRRRSARTAAGVTGGVAVAGVLALGAVALATGGGDGPAPAPLPVECNGHVQLCDRPLDQVSMFTSHNAMSVASDPGWFNAHHYNPLVEQLDAGVRGLQIDTYYGQETDRNGFGGTRLVQTDLSGKTRDALVAEIGAEAVAAAERLSGRILYGQAVTNPKLYLCHGLCEIGATDATEEYTRIREWLDDHPDQVIIIIIQDAAPIAADVAAMEAAGLDRRAWPARLGPEDPLPTLRQMIDSGKTALITHESLGTDGPAWYQPAYTIMQETPFLFATREEISSEGSCVKNRGPANAKLFLVNHWLDKQPVRTSQSEEVNTRDVLLSRSRLCQSKRGLLPNLVAVNFIEIGDTADVVDELNGLPAQLTP